MQQTQRKAVALLSGGLDSMLAARVIKDQGVHVEAINFYTGFCVEGHTHAIRKRDRDKVKRNNALWAAEQLGIKLHIIDIIEEYKSVVMNPKHGYGANLNPCLDCKVFMVSKALEWCEENGFDFVITGEVVGQRPMSQLKHRMHIVDKESGAEDRLLRPLCALKLEPTLPEREGWVDRERLYDFSGRSRKPQIALAKSLDIEDFAQPAGGCCFLTDENYSKKLADLWQTRGDRHYELDDIMLLKVGRHLRPRPHFKVIVAREEGEANFMRGYRHQFHYIELISHTGPNALVDGADLSEADLELAVQLAARYGKARDAERVEASVSWRGETRTVSVKPLPPEQIPAEWLL